jgi:hypothetical protein
LRNRRFGTRPGFRAWLKIRAWLEIRAWLGIRVWLGIERGHGEPRFEGWGMRTGPGDWLAAGPGIDESPLF